VGINVCVKKNLKYLCFDLNKHNEIYKIVNALTHCESTHSRIIEYNKLKYNISDLHGFIIYVCANIALYELIV